jgi:bis(5'-nucleosidyl)-tetraphosphatase
MLKTVISCGAVVYKKEEEKTYILLVKQSGPIPGWGIPKGHMEPGETYIKTAIREVKEETGIDIKILTRLPHVILEKRNYKKVVVPYLATQTKNLIPRCDHKLSEVVDVRWFDIDCLPQIYVYQKPIIDAAMLILGGYLDG